MPLTAHSVPFKTYILIDVAFIFNFLDVFMSLSKKTKLSNYLLLEYFVDQVLQWSLMSTDGSQLPVLKLVC